MPTRRRTLADVAFWCVSALGAALVALLLLAIAGVAPVESPGSPAAVAPLPAASTETATAPEPQARRAAPAEPEAPPTTTAPARAQRVTVTVTATRGASWITARAGSSTGRVLEERILEQGETSRLTGPRVWLLLGASANVDVLVDGEPRALAAGTVETLFSPAG